MLKILVDLRSVHCSPHTENMVVGKDGFPLSSHILYSDKSGEER